MSKISAWFEMCLGEQGLSPMASKHEATGRGPKASRPLRGLRRPVKTSDQFVDRSRDIAQAARGAWCQQVFDRPNLALQLL